MIALVWIAAACILAGTILVLRMARRPGTPPPMRLQVRFADEPDADVPARPRRASTRAEGQRSWRGPRAQRMAPTAPPTNRPARQPRLAARRWWGLPELLARIHHATHTTPPTLHDARLDAPTAATSPDPYSMSDNDTLVLDTITVNAPNAPKTPAAQEDLDHMALVPAQVEPTLELDATVDTEPAPELVTTDDAIPNDEDDLDLDTYVENIMPQSPSPDDDSDDLLSFAGYRPLPEAERSTVIEAVEHTPPTLQQHEEHNGNGHIEPSYAWLAFANTTTLDDDRRRQAIAMLEDLGEPWCLHVLDQAFREETDLRPAVFSAIVNRWHSAALQPLYEFVAYDELATTEERALAQRALDELAKPPS